MYDVYTPEERYEEEIRKVKVSIDDVDENKEIVSINLNQFFLFNVLMDSKLALDC